MRGNKSTGQAYVPVGPANHGMNFWVDPIACHTITHPIGLNPNSPPIQAMTELPAYLVAVVTGAAKE